MAIETSTAAVAVVERSGANPGFGKRLLKRPVAIASLAFLLLVAIVAVIAPSLFPGIASQQAGDLLQANQPPSGQFPLGTDIVGRDVLARLLVGTQETVVGILEAVLVIVFLGVPLGVVAGYFGGWTDRVVTWFSDLTFSIPSIAIVIVVLSVFPGSMLAGMVTFGVLAAPGLARVVRAVTLSARQELYVEAARVAGLPPGYIILRHILPRVKGVIIVQVSLLAGVALIVQSGLAFLRLLTANPAPSWGGMVADGITVLSANPWLIWPPGLAITLTVLALGLLGDAVRDVAVEQWNGRSYGKNRRRKPATEQGSSNPVVRSHEPALLEVRGLTVAADGQHGDTVTLVDDVSLTIRAGECVGIVGESGCGKSVTASAILGILTRGAHLDAGTISLNGSTRDWADEVKSVRGTGIAFISQEPLISLDPAFSIGSQLVEAVRQHHNVSRVAARQRAIELLESVHLPDPASTMRKYPHELSGGMAQRVSIARALAGDPLLLVADEPTTALDVTVQAEVLNLLLELKETRGMSVLLITHDWGVVAKACDRAIVMYAGQIVEETGIHDIFAQPQHPYTAGLLASDPHRASPGDYLPAIDGTVPPPGSWPQGCRFAARCRFAQDACRTSDVILRPVDTKHHDVRCIRAEELSLT